MKDYQFLVEEIQILRELVKHYQLVNEELNKEILELYAKLQEKGE